MKKAVVGILAHVDAGKTTLAEAILYKTGKIRRFGRVDKGDTLLDNHELERSRGITIFAGQAHFPLGNWEIDLLDTPGHVDFSAETERILQVLDYAVMVISGTDGVQAHTRTLWRLLALYGIPTFLFVTKMDFARRAENDLMAELRRELSENCIDFSAGDADKNEALAMCREDVMEEYLRTGKVDSEFIRELVKSRAAFPCFFGSGLKLTGIDEFLEGLADCFSEQDYPAAFGARIYKITHDENGAKLAHMKITGGTLSVRDSLCCGDKPEKISEIRLYSGAKYTSAESIGAGSLCTVLGLSEAKKGQGLGTEEQADAPVLEPVMKYRIVLPADVQVKTFLPKLKLLEEEDPQLDITWNERLQEISVSLMGEVQVEILKSLIAERFDVEVQIDHGRVQYKETIADTVEGVGHYEPLRHYAEVHLILSPLERGRGLVFERKCRDDSLEPVWQRLIMTHLYEKQHLGVLTGSPITDMKITLAAGRAHVKHTEGGDFRQATYRAVRQGLMRAKSILLEPYYQFRLEVPSGQIGRAINDIKLRGGSFSSPEELGGGIALLTGKAPVRAMNTYAAELAAYTSGRGKLQLTVCGYDVCRNAEQVMAEYAYRPESDTENPADSVFCAHGGGFAVKWDKVEAYMHLESVLKPQEDPIAAKWRRRSYRIEEDELEAIMEREFGRAKTYQALHRPAAVSAEKPDKTPVNLPARQKFFIVDGYNCIFAWERLKAIAEYNLETARRTLADALCNYAAFTRNHVILVFDGYAVKDNRGEKINYHNIHIVYTKEHETGDIYMQKLVAEIGKNDKVYVVTSDALIQLSALHHGALRVSAGEFEREVTEAENQIADFLAQLEKEDKLPPDMVVWGEAWETFRKDDKEEP